MLRRWLVRWLEPVLLDVIRDEVDLYIADIEAALSPMRRDQRGGEPQALHE